LHGQDLGLVCRVVWHDDERCRPCTLDVELYPSQIVDRDVQRETFLGADGKSAARYDDDMLAGWGLDLDLLIGVSTL
jgi:hypothetical protein